MLFSPQKEGGGKKLSPLWLFLFLLLLPFTLGQSWDFYRGEDFTGVTTDWTGGTLNTTGDRYETYSNYSTWTWGNNYCGSNVTACKWTVQAYIGGNNNLKIYPQTRNSSTDNGHTTSTDTGALTQIKPEPNYNFTLNIADDQWVEMNLTYNRTNKRFTYEDSTGNSGYSIFSTDTQNYTYMRIETGELGARDSFFAINYSYLWLPAGQWVNGSGGGGGSGSCPSTLPLNQSCQGFVSGTHKKSYYDLVNKGLLQQYDIATQNGSYYYDGTYLTVPKYDSSTDFDTMNTCGGGSIGTLNMTNHFVVTDELSQFGQMISMGNNETIVVAYMNTLDAINLSGQAGKEWCFAYQDGTWNLGIVSDTASDGDARIIDSLFTISGNEEFSNSTRVRAYLHAKSMSESFVANEILTGTWTNAITGGTINYLGCGGTNVCNAVTNSGFFYTGYGGDNAIAMLKACGRTGNTTYCDVADDLAYQILQASGNSSTGYWTNSSGFRTIEGVHYKFDGASPLRAVCTSNCDQDWDYSDAPRLSSLGIVDWRSRYNSFGINTNITDYMVDWSNSVDDSGDKCVDTSALDYGVKWYPNGSCSTHQSGYFELGLGSQLLFSSNETKVYDFLQQAFTKYTNTTHKWDGSGEFGVYRQTFPVRTYGFSMALDNNSYTLYSSLSPTSNNATINVTVLLRGYGITNWNFSIFNTTYSYGVTNTPTFINGTIYDADITESTSIHCNSTGWDTEHHIFPDERIGSDVTIKIIYTSSGSGLLYTRLLYTYNDSTTEYSDIRAINQIIGVPYYYSYDRVNSTKDITTIKLLACSSTGVGTHGWSHNNWYGKTIQAYSGLVTVPIGDYDVQLSNNTGYTSEVERVYATDNATYYVTLTPLQTRIFYLNFYNESTNQLITTENVYGEIIGNYNATNFTSSTGYATINSLIPDDYEIRYWVDPDVPRSYYVTLEENSFENLSLYVVDTDSSDWYSIVVKDEIGRACQDNLVKLLRYYVDINGYRTVEMEKTNTLGAGLFRVVPNSVPYKLQFSGSCGSYTSYPSPIVSSTDDYTISSAQGYLTAFDYVSGISYSIDYLTSTDTYVFSWSDEKNVVTSGCLTVDKVNSGVRTQAYYGCSSASSGSLIYSVNSSDFNESVYYGFGTLFTNTEYSNIMSNVLQNRLPYFQNWGTTGLFLGSMMLISLVLFASSSAVMVVVTFLFGLGVLVYSGIGIIGLSWPVFVGVAVIGAIMLYKLRRIA